MNQRSRSVARHQNTTFQIRVSQNISGATQNESALQHSPKRGRVSKQNIFTPFFLKPKIVALADRLTTLACTPSGVGARAPLCREGADFVSLSIWDLGVSADFGYAERAVRSNFMITLNLLLSFERSPLFLQLFRRKLRRCFCCEAPEMFGGLRNSPSLSEHQRDPSSFSSSLTNRTLIHCCQMTFKKSCWHNFCHHSEQEMMSALFRLHRHLQ